MGFFSFFFWGGVFLSFFLRSLSSIIWHPKRVCNFVVFPNDSFTKQCLTLTDFRAQTCHADNSSRQKKQASLRFRGKKKLVISHYPIYWLLEPFLYLWPVTIQRPTFNAQLETIHLTTPSEEANLPLTRIACLFFFCVNILRQRRKHN